MNLYTHYTYEPVTVGAIGELTTGFCNCTRRAGMPLLSQGLGCGSTIESPRRAVVVFGVTSHLGACPGVESRQLALTG